MIFRSAVIAVCAALGLCSLVASANDEALKIAAAVGEKYQLDIKKVFAANCSWCHDGYGMDGGKGPKLAGTNQSQEQIATRIADGKSGYMPGFKKTLKPEQIQALAEYIKALPAN